MSEEYTLNYEILTPLLEEIEHLRQTTDLTLIQRLRKVFSKISTKNLINYAYTPNWIHFLLNNGSTLHLEIEHHNGDRRASLDPPMLCKKLKTLEFTIPFRKIIP